MVATRAGLAECGSMALALLSACCGAAPAAPPTGNTIAGRHPVAAVPLADGRRLAVACERSGSLAIVDVIAGTVEHHAAVAERLVDLAGPTPAGQLVALDAARHELLLIDRSAPTSGPALWRVHRRIRLESEPTTVVLGADGQWAGVASRWSHRWQYVPLAESSPESSPGATGDLASDVSPPPLELPFAPSSQCVLPDGNVVVADAFGGHLALLQPKPSRLLAWTSLPIHNIRGLRLHPDRRSLVFTHQVLEERRAITREEILAGRLLRNGVSQLPLAALRQDPSGWDQQRQFESLDQLDRDLRGPSHRTSEAHPTEPVGPGAADPAGLAWWSDQRIVALAGRGQVALVHERTGETQWRDVGARPTAVVALPAAEVVAVLNSLDDSLTLLDPRGQRAPRRVSLGAPPLDSPQARGERLFFDARLSAGGFLSCHSCHTDGHTHGLLADTLGDETLGTPKRTLTLLGTALTYRWAWIGTQPSLHDQVKKSIEQTMHGAGGTFQAVSDLVAYLHTLPPPPPLAPPRSDQPSDTALRERGRLVFAAHGCGDCHIPPLVYSSHESYDVGLSDERGVRKFNPPSLRGVGQLYRLLHDNRATSLEAVFRDHHHPSGLTLDDDELAALVRFLRSL